MNDYFKGKSSESILLLSDKVEQNIMICQWEADHLFAKAES